MRTWLLFTLPALVMNAATIPVGTYTSCAQGTNNPSGNLFPRTAGFQDGARLVVTGSGATVTSTYVDQNGVTQALQFASAGRWVGGDRANGPGDSRLQEPLRVGGG